MNFDQFETLIWVIPGVFYIYYYNTFTPHKKITISGWPYLFTIVIIVSILNIPHYMLGHISSETNIKGCSWLASTFLYAFLLLLPRIELVKKFLPQSDDDFYNKCSEWENKAVLLTLKNGKVYVGSLWKYPSNPNLQYECQTISIIPSFSGYRKKEQKWVEWTTYYPEVESYPADMELVIPRSEIVSFSKFNHEAHKHFENSKQYSKIGFPFLAPTK